jgi:hypothetical protein
MPPTATLQDAGRDRWGNQQRNSNTNGFTVPKQVSHEEARDMVEFASFATVFTGTSLEHEYAAG